MKVLRAAKGSCGLISVIHSFLSYVRVCPAGGIEPKQERYVREEMQCGRDLGLEGSGFGMSLMLFVCIFAESTPGPHLQTVALKQRHTSCKYWLQALVDFLTVK